MRQTKQVLSCTFIIILIFSAFLIGKEQLCAAVINDKQATVEQESEHNEEHNEEQGEHIVLFVIPELGLTDAVYLFEQLEPEQQHNWQVAGMSMRAEQGKNIWLNWLTLASGQRLEKPVQWQMTNVQDQIKVRFFDEDDMSELMNTETFPGWLGERLAEQRIQTYVWGNSDLQTQQRLGALLTMRQNGTAAGQINSEIWQADADFPGGRRANLDQLSERLSSVFEAKGRTFTVVEIGDLQTIHSMYEELEHKASITDQEHPDMLIQHWVQQFSQWLTKHVLPTEQTQVWLISPHVSSAARQQGQSLAPLFIHNSKQPPGLLTSATTKQAGLVSNLDLIPHLSSVLGLEAYSVWPGKPMLVDTKYSSTLTEQETMQAFAHDAQYIFQIHQHRRFVITAYLLTLIFSLMSATAYWLLAKRNAGRKMLAVLIGTVLISPVFFMWLTPLIQYVHPSVWIGVLLLFSLSAAALLKRIFAGVQYLAVLGLLNTGFILFDLWQGSTWMKRSFLGYDPIIGARFYGLGNEYAGVLIGSALLFVTAWSVSRQQSKRQLLFISACYVFILYALIAPDLGTNAGAALGGFFAFTGSVFLLWGWRWRWRYIFVIAGLFGLFMLAVFLLHLYGEHTHIGSFIHLFMHWDTQAISEIVLRKLEMNKKLIRSSLWGKLFVTSLIGLAMLSFQIKKEEPQSTSSLVWRQGFRAMIIGALALLVFNDSGIVAAAAMIIFLTFPFLYLRFTDEVAV